MAPFAVGCSCKMRAKLARPEPSRTLADRTKSDLYERIYAVVRKIPKGRVATYGQVAALAGFPKHARSVGYALAALRSDRGPAVPWQRVINAQGRVSLRADPGFEGLQEEMLRQEGVEIALDGKIDLKRFRWRPRSFKRGRVGDPVE